MAATPSEKGLTQEQKDAIIKAVQDMKTIESTERQAKGETIHVHPKDAAWEVSYKT